MAKKKELPVLKDVMGNVVCRGDEVIVLIKVRCYRGLSDAYFGHAIYIGPGSYGYEFIDVADKDEYNSDPDNIADPIRIKNPELINLDAYTNNGTRREN